MAINDSGEPVGTRGVAASFTPANVRSACAFLREYFPITAGRLFTLAAP